MPSLRIPVVGSLTNRNPNAALADTTDQQFSNGFPEVTKNVITGKIDVVLSKRTGLAASADVQASATAQYGSVVWTTNSAATAPVAFSYLKSTGTSMMFFNEAGVQHGADVANTSGCSFMSETDINATGHLTATLIDTGVNEMWFLPQAGAWTQITSGNFPSGVMPSHAHIDGYMVVATETGRLHNSDLNSLANWSASSYISLSGGGNGLGVVRHGSFIVGFSDYSTEFFYNAGNASGSVLSRVRDGLTRIGAVRPAATGSPTFRTIGDSVYFVGQNADNGARGIYRLEGTGVKKISTSAIDRMVDDAQVSSPLGSFQMFGMTHVAFAGGGSGDRCLCYCVDTGFWWVFLPAGTISIVSLIGAANSSGYAYAYLTSSSNAKLYSANPNSPVWQDGGSAYTMSVQTGNMDLGTRNKKYWKSLALTGDSQSSTSSVNVSYADDDSWSFSTPRAIDMTTTPPPLLTRLGASRRRSWKLTHSANTACRLAAMELTYTIGKS